MEAKEFIESGILELYASGALDKNERDEVELMAKKFPEVAAELNAIQLSLEKHSMLHAITPPTEIKEKIQKELFGNLKSEAISVNHNNTRFYQYAVAASVVLLMLSSFAAFYFAGKLNSAENQLSLLQTQYDTLNKNMNLVIANQSHLTDEMNMINGMHTMKVKLSGTEKHPGMEVLVYYDMETKNIMLDSGNLPQLPDSLRYQLWAMMDDKIIDVGTFNSKLGLIKLRPASEADVFAITIEKQGGSATPNYDEMVANGKISI